MVRLMTVLSAALILGAPLALGRKRKVSETRYIWLRTLACIPAGTSASEP